MTGKVMVDVRTLDRLPNCLLLTYPNGTHRIVSIQVFVGMVVRKEVKSK